MFIKQCNINETDRINRTVIGGILILAAILGISRVFAVLLGIVLIAQGIVGWCSIPYFRDLLKSGKH